MSQPSFSSIPGLSTQFSTTAYQSFDLMTFKDRQTDFDLLLLLTFTLLFLSNLFFVVVVSL